MEIIWLGHACFAVESGGFRAVIDPYTMEYYPPLHTEADAVYCSHGHADHNYTQAVTLRPGRDNPFSVETVDTFHDEEGGRLRGSNKIHLLRAEDMTLVHCGDLGHFPTEKQLTAIRGCDALLIPVGGYYTIDAVMAKRVCDAAKPRVIVPMHYRHDPYGLRPVGPVEDFLSLWPESSVTKLDTNRFTLAKDAPRGVIVPVFAG